MLTALCVEISLFCFTYGTSPVPRPLSPVPCHSGQSDMMVQYENACTARIQQFDESNSDEGEEETGELDPWMDSNIGMNSTLDRNSRCVMHVCV